MAENKKISELHTIVKLHDDDEFIIVDKSTKTGVDASTTGKTSKVKLWQLKQELVTSGEKGQKGTTGPQGGAGANGRDGQKGEPGTRGRDGINGERGLKGQRGETGPQGVAGANGRDGQRGVPGTNGAKGQKGVPGINGRNGSNGGKGEKGVPGINGKNGANGSNGGKGQKGERGQQGIPGPTNPYVQQLGEASSPDYKTASSRRVNPNSKNPTNSYYAVSTFGNQGNVTGQLATHFQSGQLYSRGFNSSWSSWKKYLTDDAPIQISSSTDQKLILQGSNHPYIRFREGTTDRGYIQWHATNNDLRLVNSQYSSTMALKQHGIYVYTKSGYVNMGSHNSAWAHFHTDRPRYYFSKPISVHGDIQDYATGKKYIHEGNIGNYAAAKRPYLIAKGTIKVQVTNAKPVTRSLNDIDAVSGLKRVFGTYKWQPGDVVVVLNSLTGGSYSFRTGGAFNKKTRTFTWALKITVNSNGTYTADFPITSGKEYAYRSLARYGTFFIEIYRTK